MSAVAGSGNLRIAILQTVRNEGVPLPARLLVVNRLLSCE